MRSVKPRKIYINIYSRKIYTRKIQNTDTYVCKLLFVKSSEIRKQKFLWKKTTLQD